MKYEREECFDGDLAKAIDTAKNTFLPNGFEIVESSESRFEVVKRNCFFGNNQNPWNGVSKVCICGSSGKISLEAELGGVKKMIKFLIIFIVAMAIFFLALFGFIFGVQQKQPIAKVVLISLGPLAPWPVLIPVMGIWFKKRAEKALDTLLKNMVSAGKY